MNPLKREEGFTLIEVIISILILAVVSAIVIQLYITANNVSVKAQTMDWAVNQASSAVEILESYDDPRQAGEHPLLMGSGIEVNKDMDVLGQGVLHTQVYYDSDYQEVTSGEGAYTMTVSVVLKTLPDIVDYETAKGPQEEVNYLGTLIAEVVDEAGEVLVHHEVDHYYTYVR